MRNKSDKDELGDKNYEDLEFGDKVSLFGKVGEVVSNGGAHRN